MLRKLLRTLHCDQGFRQSNFLERLCSSNAAPPLDLCLDTIRKDLNAYRGGEVSLTTAGVDQSISVISISQPGKKNALTGSMCVGLYDSIQHVSERREAKAVIVRGLNGMFCAGVDLTMGRRIADPINGERFSYFMQTALCNLRNLKIPSYCVLQGQAMGGGAEIVVACDFTLASPLSTIHFVQGRMGIVPGFGAATHLTRKLGYHKALSVLLSPAALNSDYANRLGLVDHIIPNDKDCKLPFSDDGLLEEAVEFIGKQVGHLPVEVVHGLKSVIMEASRLDYNDSVSHERQIFKSLWGAEANLRSLNQNLKHK